MLKLASTRVYFAPLEQAQQRGLAGLDAGPQVVRRVARRSSPTSARGRAGRPHPRRAARARRRDPRCSGATTSRRTKPWPAPPPSPATVAITPTVGIAASPWPAARARRAVRSSSSRRRRVGQRPGAQCGHRIEVGNARRAGTLRQSSSGDSPRVPPVKTPGSAADMSRGEGRRDGAAVSTIEDLRDEITREERVVNLHADGSIDGRGDPASAAADAPPGRRRAGRAAVHHRRERRLDPVPRRQLDRPGRRAHRADRVRRPHVALPVRQGAAPQAAEPPRPATSRTSTAALAATMLRSAFVADADRCDPRIARARRGRPAGGRAVVPPGRRGRRVAAPRRTTKASCGRSRRRSTSPAASRRSRPSRTTSCSRSSASTREPALLNSGTVSVLCVPLVRDDRADRPDHARRRRRRPVRRRRRRAARPLRALGGERDRERPALRSRGVPPRPGLRPPTPTQAA